MKYVLVNFTNFNGYMNYICENFFEKFQKEKESLIGGGHFG